jgi:4'-phosphopantetheinyl transferase EntD
VEVEQLGTALAGLAQSGVITGVRLISEGDMSTLHPTELAVVANAVERRKHEFASGRMLLRQLLETADPIPVGPTRAPILPPGVVGSLAHDRSVVVAALGRDHEVKAMGIDVEPDEVLSNEMARVILREDEVGVDAHLAFTLKEAVYKAWSNSGGRMLGHHEVRLVVDDGRFTATVIPDDRRFGGRFTTVAGRHLALVVVVSS